MNMKGKEDKGNGGKLIRVRREKGLYGSKEGFDKMRRIMLDKEGMRERKVKLEMGREERVMRIIDKKRIEEGC